MTIAVKAPQLVLSPPQDVLRYWIDCQTEDWPQDLQPVQEITFEDGQWTHRFRFKPFDQDSQYLQADCRLDKIESTRPFSVVELPNETPEKQGVNGLYRLDWGRLDGDQPDASAARYDGYAVVFTPQNSLAQVTGIATRQITVATQFAVVDGGDDVLDPPGLSNLANAPFPSLPVILRGDVGLDTNAKALGAGTDRLGTTDLLTYVLDTGELTVVLQKKLFAWVAFAIGVLAPVVLGFGVGILTAALREDLS